MEPGFVFHPPVMSEYPQAHTPTFPSHQHYIIGKQIVYFLVELYISVFVSFQLKLPLICRVERILILLMWSKVSVIFLVWLMVSTLCICNVVVYVLVSVVTVCAPK